MAMHVRRGLVGGCLGGLIGPTTSPWLVHGLRRVLINAVYAGMLVWTLIKLLPRILVTTVIRLASAIWAAVKGFVDTVQQSFEKR
jgi:hypothetical protein